MKKSAYEPARLEAELEKLRAGAREPKPELPVGFQQQIYELEEKQKVAREELGELPEVSSGAWQRARDSVEEASTDPRTGRKSPRLASNSPHRNLARIGAGGFCLPVPRER